MKQLSLFDNQPPQPRHHSRSPDSVAPQLSPGSLQMSCESLVAWKLRIQEHQQAQRQPNTQPMQPSLFELPTPQYCCDPDIIDPFALRVYSLDFWAFPHLTGLGEGDPCLYFVVDRAVPLLLYVGETIHHNQRWKNGHHCQGYLDSYVTVHRKYQLDTKPAIAFEWGVPEETRQRQRMELSLIKKWQPPFNKESWERFGQPFPDWQKG